MLKNKSFLVKLLTLICVICCSFALMLGAVSCAEGPVGPAGPQGEQGPAGEDGKDGDDGKDGEDGQDGEDGRGITKTEINDEGELEITYSDGTVVNLGVVVGESAPECDHDFFEYEAVKHYMEDGEVVNGVIIKVCKKNCGTAHYEVGALHNYEETVVAPKCTEQGYTAAVCTVCGDAVDPHDFTDPTGHKDFDPTNTEDWYPVVEACKTICEDGGAVVYVCEDCDATVAAVVEATGHHSTAWSKVSGQHKLTGSCYICGNNVTVDVPELNQANVTAGKLTYEVTSEKENCGDTGVGTYTYVIDGQTFTYEKDIPATGHILDKGEGVEINDSMMPLDYDTYKDDVTFFADEELTCDASAATPAYFECKECGESVLVSVRKAHTEPTGGDEVEITPGDVAAKLAALTNADKNVYVVPATCTVAGSRTFYCSACEEAVTVAVPELEHKKAYTLKEVGDKVYLVTYCANCDKLAAAGAQTCGFAQTEEEIENYRVIESVADTCEAAGYKVIGYTPVGATEEITLKIEGTKLNHKINNTRPAIDKPFDYNVWKDYVTLFADKALTCADGGVQAYFKCEDCDASVLISVKVPHAAPTKTEEVTGVTSDAIKADLELATPVTYAKDTVYVLNATCEA
ncbi:MAG: hypothetical protein IJY26_03290, partial [Clostridia bacterium]|nr:hypothetical protein [Clostridia bacterium]